MSRFSHSDIIDLTVVMHHETTMAVLVSDDGDREKAVWLPKSRIEIERQSQRGSVVVVTLPERLAILKGLV